MLISPTNVIGEIGTVSTSAFSTIAPIVYIVMGIALAFFIAEILINIVSERNLDKRISDTVERSRAARDL